jgi:hypothetical protein
MFIAARIWQVKGIKELVNAPTKPKCVSRLLEVMLQFCPALLVNNDEESLLEQTIIQLLIEP